MDTKGGRIEIDINGRTYVARAKATLKPARATRTNGVNQNGTGYSTVAPKLAGIEVTFDRGSGLDWGEAEMLQEINVTFTEKDAGRVHVFTGARFEGEPSIDTETGEISGLSIMGDNYRVT